MKLLFEGARYPIRELKAYFGDKFYHQKGDFGYIDTVGYYHSLDNELFYFLPKLFISDQNTILDTELNYLEFFYQGVETALEQNITLLNWFRKFSILFYKSLAEYKKRSESNIVQLGETLQLSTNIGKNEFSFLDLVLTILNFYKKNKDFFVFHIKEQQSQKHKKINWNKTIRKQQPLIMDNVPVYNQLDTKTNEINNEELLMTYFYSLLLHLKEEYQIDLDIDCPYTLIKGERFKNLMDNGLYKIKKIRNNYFSDKLRAIYNLLVLFFEKTFIGNVQKKNDDFIVVKQYHWVFEDMIDKLLSDSLSDRKTSNGTSLNKLKNNYDGKIIDHLFEFESLLDRDESIFYIGDSKYYKYNSLIGENSVYKQFTYAKNVIQFHIDLLNEGANVPSLIGKNIRYRDEVTEGYSISPNFFIQGKIMNDLNDFNNHYLTPNTAKGIERNYHFKDRLFDRDTLFINYYDINFLFVLNAYTNFSDLAIIEWRRSIKQLFKNHFLDYFQNKSDFELYELTFNTKLELQKFVDTEYRHLIGKIICTSSQPKKLILAKYKQNTNDFIEKLILERHLSFTINTFYLTN